MFEECAVSFEIKAKSKLFSHLVKLVINYMCWGNGTLFNSIGKLVKHVAKFVNGIFVHLIAFILIYVL